jgi:hypothetical protein
LNGDEKSTGAVIGRVVISGSGIGEIEAWRSGVPDVARSIVAPPAGVYGAQSTEKITGSTEIVSIKIF